MPLDVRDRATIVDIRNAAASIAEFIAGIDRGAFLEDAKTRSAVVLQVLIIGEAAKRLSPAARAHFPSIPWPKIMRTRDKLIHHYEGWDLESIWEMAVDDVPELRQALSGEESS